MSSLPSKSTFLEAYNANNLYEKNSSQNTTTKIYEREMKYLREEIEYWKKEHSLVPSDTILKKIAKVENEIRALELKMQTNPDS